MRISALISVLACLLCCSCAMQTIIHATGKKPPLCQSLEASSSTLVLWGVAWRDNQKNPALREEIASRAITSFFSRSNCLPNATILKTVAGRPAIEMSDADSLKFAIDSKNAFSRIVLIRIEELGPYVIIHPSPVMWEGGTEVALRVRVLETKTSSLQTDTTCYWKKGGPFVLRGTKALDSDMEAALASVFTATRPK